MNDRRQHSREATGRTAALWPDVAVSAPRETERLRPPAAALVGQVSQPPTPVLDQALSSVLDELFADTPEQFYLGLFISHDTAPAAPGVPPANGDAAPPRNAMLDGGGAAVPADAANFLPPATNSVQTASALLAPGTPNNPPHAYDAGPYSLLHDTDIADDISGSAYDPDGDPITYALVSGPAHAAAFSYSGGSFSYEPLAGYLGGDSFSYKVSDGLADSEVATVSFDVYNNAPVASDAGPYSLLHDTDIADDISGNAYDPDGDPITYALVSGPTHAASFSFSGGTFSYTPALHYVGGDSFTYKVSDGLAESSIATVSFDVYNNAPVALGGAAFDVLHARHLAASALGNDYDPDGDELSFILVSGPSHADSFSLHADGTFDYQGQHFPWPTGDYVGPDSFTYKVTDGLLTSGVASVTLNVYDNPPDAFDDAYDLLHDTTLSASVLANDTDPDNDIDDAVLGSPPLYAANFTFTNGGFSYTPQPGFVGTDGFDYTTNDGAAGDSASVVINVFNNGPISADDFFTTLHDTPLTGNVLANDSDPDQEDLDAVLANGPAHAAAFNFDPSTGAFYYVPAAHWAGTDTFSYYATDGAGQSSAATVTIEVTNNVPTAGDDSFSLIVNTTLSVPAKGVLENDTDGDNDPLQAGRVSGPTHGVLTLNADGSFTYLPDLDYAGPDQFTYRATDQVAPSEIATVFLDVVRVMVDLDVDSDNSGAIDGTDEEDLVEMSSPGQVLRVNTDDDNSNAQPDRDDNPFEDLVGPAPDYDLVPAHLSLENPIGDNLAGYTLSLSVNNASIRANIKVSDTDTQGVNNGS